MSEDALNIPIGADLASLQQSFSQIQGHVQRMGTRISTSLARSNGAFGRTSSLASNLRATFAKVWSALGRGARAAYSAMVAGARKAGTAIRGLLSGVASLPGKLFGALGSALPIGGLLSAAGAIGLAVTSISKAANMETLETAFAPLLGGAAGAQARIEELAAFAASTPFELPEVAKASRLLEILTKGALATGEGFRLVGDVAAATQAPFEEIAMWIGRLYDGLQSGRPVGQAMRRLQELGAISGDVRGRIEALQKSGAAGADIWNEAAGALGRFSGSMERQSQTWNGKLSTLRDNISMVMAEFGKPIIDGLKPFLDMAIARIDSMREAAKGFGQSIQTGLNALLAAFQTGNVASLLGASLQIAMIRGVNILAAGFTAVVSSFRTGLGDTMAGLSKSLADSGISLTFQALFQGIGDLLVGKLRSATADFLDALPGGGKKAAGLRSIGAADEARSEQYFNIAKAGLASMDLASGFADISSVMSKGKDAFAAAWADAAATPFIDPSLAQEKFRETWDKISAQMEKNAQEAAARAADMDARLTANSADGTLGPAAAIQAAAKAATPSVTSLGRVGGGGFGSFSPMVSEQKRSNKLLTAIEKAVSRPSAGLPVTA